MTNKPPGPRHGRRKRAAAQLQRGYRAAGQPLLPREQRVGELEKQVAARYPAMDAERFAAWLGRKFALHEVEQERDQAKAELEAAKKHRQCCIEDYDKRLGETVERIATLERENAALKRSMDQCDLADFEERQDLEERAETAEQRAADMKEEIDALHGYGVATQRDRAIAAEGLVAELLEVARETVETIERNDLDGYDCGVWLSPQRHGCDLCWAKELPLCGSRAPLGWETCARPKGHAETDCQSLDGLSGWAAPQVSGSEGGKEAR